MHTATIADVVRPEAPQAFRFFSPAFRARLRRAFELLAMPYMVMGSRYL
ncbi:hypothetical protein [Massilia sp. X63]